MKQQIQKPIATFINNLHCDRDIYYIVNNDYNNYIITCTKYNYTKYYKRAIDLIYHMHREDGFAYHEKRTPSCNKFYLNGEDIKIEEFTKETNHILCSECETFCKQKCFF